ncbi:MAG: tyrosine--tRNA ligase [Candidatus Omnitrophica bacterium]|nr:tyrosine--tRNA ligase [Candidatus Omnitrophota bacterium]
MSIKEALSLIKRGTVEIIEEKGLLAKLEESAKKKRPLVIKAGFDPTAPDIHLGHTVLLKKMRHFQDLGHRIVFLIGDYTAMIGDPSGASKTRPRLSREEIVENAKTYKKQVSKVLDIKKLEVCFNSKWLEKMNGADVAELMSRYTVQRMLERDDFEKRYKQHKSINMLEFLYPLLQGYDSVELKADIELGGNDQKFNLLVGRDIQNAYGQQPQIIITTPLLEGTDGVQKMSKSLDNYIGITEPAKEMFGKIMSISDELMWKYYELLTDVPLNEIEKMKDGMHPKDAKARLAKEIITTYHSKKDALKAEKEFEKVHKKREYPEHIHEYCDSNIESKLWICDILTKYEGVHPITKEKQGPLAKSTSEARRKIKEGSVKIDGTKIADENAQINTCDGMIVQLGKRMFLRFRIKPRP